MAPTVTSRWPSAALFLTIALLLFGCGERQPGGDPGIDAETRQIRAIDHHAHPVRAVGEGEKPDRSFDALPVDNMEPASDPIMLRPDAPAVLDAWRALYGYTYGDLRPEHLRDGIRRKQQIMQEHGDRYPAWVLDQMGVDVMIANRVDMGSSIQPPRFRWVPYADALIFPLDNSRLARRNSDRRSFFALEDALLHAYLKAVGLGARPGTLTDYLTRVVSPTLERQKEGGAIGEKFEAAYLRSLAFDGADRTEAERVYAAAATGTVPDADYKILQDFLFRYVAAECGRLGMTVHVHTMAGAGSYFDVRGTNPLLLETVLNDPELRKTRFVQLHGGWPFTREITALLEKPNAYLDYSAQSLLLSPETLSRTLREWLEWVPEKVMFGTDAYPYSAEIGWEESGWIAARNGRKALAIALTGMMRDGEISRGRASELARMVLRDNARALYGWPGDGRTAP